MYLRKAILGLGRKRRRRRNLFNHDVIIVRKLGRNNAHSLFCDLKVTLINANLHNHITAASLSSNADRLTKRLLHTRRQTVSTSTGSKRILAQDVVRVLVNAEEETRAAKSLLKSTVCSHTARLKSVVANLQVRLGNNTDRERELTTRITHNRANHLVVRSTTQVHVPAILGFACIRALKSTVCYEFTISCHSSGELWLVYKTTLSSRALAFKYRFAVPLT